MKIMKFLDMTPWKVVDTYTEVSEESAKPFFTVHSKLRFALINSVLALLKRKVHPIACHEGTEGG